MFYDAVTLRKFAIVKTITIVVGNRADYEALKPTAPYIPKKKVQREPVKEVTHGEPPEALAVVKWTARLMPYELPKALKTILDMPVVKERIRLLRSGFVPRELSSATHARWFHVMLFIEEHQSA
jgi:helicase MOV-10